MRENKTNYLAINISHYHLQLLKVNRKKQIEFWHEEQLKEGVVVKGRIKEAETLSTLLRQILDKAKIKAKEVVLGISEEVAFVKVVSFPKLSSLEIDEALRWQIKSILPFSYHEIYLDWKLIETNKHETQILIIALPREVIDGYLKLLESLGLRIVALETTGLTLLRAFQEKAKAVILPEKTEIKIAGKLKDINNLSLAIELDKQEATIVAIKNFEHVCSTALVNASNQEEFLKELKKVINFYTTGDDKCSLISIFICGNLFNESIVEAIKQETGCQEVMFYKDNELSKQIDNNNLLSFFLATKKVEPPKDPQTINILPVRIYKQYYNYAACKYLRKWLNIFTFLMLGNLIFLTLLLVFFISKVNSKSGELIGLKSSQTNAKENLTLDDQLYLSKIQQLIKFPIERDKWTTMFNKIKASQPEGVTLSQFELNFKENKGKVSGFSKDRTSLLHFKEKIEEQGFKNATIPLSNLEKVSNFSFTLSFKLEEEKSAKN